MAEMQQPAGVILGAIILARSDGLVVVARSNKPSLTTYEFHPPEIRG